MGPRGVRLNSPCADSLLTQDRKSTRLNSSHPSISYAVFCLQKKKKHTHITSSAPLYSTPTLSFLSLFFTDTATTEIYTLSLHDALPILGSLEFQPPGQLLCPAVAPSHSCP